MKRVWFLKKIINYINKSSDKKHAFLLRSSESVITNEYFIKKIKTEEDIDVDIYSNCKDLLFNLNKYKSYYNVGFISDIDKKNTADIFKNLVQTINPKIRIVIYSEKNI